MSGKREVVPGWTWWGSSGLAERKCKEAWGGRAVPWAFPGHLLCEAAVSVLGSVVPESLPTSMAWKDPARASASRPHV